MTLVAYMWHFLTFAWFKVDLGKFVRGPSLLPLLTFLCVLRLSARVFVFGFWLWGRSRNNLVAWISDFALKMK
jgi:hypothetical protein